MNVLLKALTIFSLSIISFQQVCLANISSKPMKNSQKKIFTPESILPAGIDSAISTNPYTGESGHARKGTVAATLNNIALLNILLSEKVSSKDATRIQEVTEAISTLIPSLKVIGVFDLFTLEEWLTSETQPGRILTTVLYLQKYPQNITPEIKRRLLQIQNYTKIRTLSDSITKTLKEVS